MYWSKSCCWTNKKIWNESNKIELHEKSRLNTIQAKIMVRHSFSIQNLFIRINLMKFVVTLEIMNTILDLIYHLKITHFVFWLRVHSLCFNFNWINFNDLVFICFTQHILNRTIKIISIYCLMYVRGWSYVRISID